MIYQVFFIACVVTVIAFSILYERRERALLVGCIGLVVAYLVEFNGVSNEDWSYADVDSILRVSDIPIEILFGYFTASFMAIILIEYLPRLSTEERRIEVLQYLLLVSGVVMLIIAYTYDSMSVVLGWAFLGIYGLSVSRDKSIPLIVGLMAFLGDWLVENMLIHGTEYYSSGWNSSIALVFMFAGMALAGILTHPSFPIDFLSPQVEEEEPS